MSGAPGDFRRAVACSAAVLVVFASTAGVSGESGVNVLLPEPANLPAGSPRVSPDTGLTLSVDSRWSCEYGYRPFTFRFELAAADTADRSITVRLVSFPWGGRNSPAIVEQDVDLPAGKTTAEFTIATPQLSRSQSCVWMVWVDGEYEPYLSLTEDTAIRQSPQPAAALRVLRPTAAGRATGRDAIAELAEALNRFRQESGRDETSQPLPDRWLLYSGLDLVQMSVDELLESAEKHPEAVAALRRWVASGGSLWIEQAGGDFQRLPEVSAALQLADATRFARGVDVGGPLENADEWSWRRFRLKGTGGDERLPQGGVAIAQEAPGGPRRVTTEGWFAEALIGFGRVTAFPGSWSKRPPRSLRSQLFRAAGRDTSGELLNTYARESAWQPRHGLAPDTANVDFSKLLPLSAGRAPVNAFRVLITLFVAVAGPLNFWLLRRRRQTHLMVLTVPLMAAFMTLGLLGYATLSEGFGVRVRARSVTMLDQPRGELSAWSRICYYAGRTPEEGLVFSDGAAVYPILPGWNDPASSTPPLRSRRVDWVRGEQRLGPEWLPARESTQLLTVQSAASGAAVVIEAAEGRVVATNHLGAEATMLLVFDDQGDPWLVESAPQAEQVELQRCEELDAVAAVRTQTTENVPTLPVGLDAAADNELLDRQRQRNRKRMRREQGIDYSPHTLTDNLLNRAIDRLTGLEGSDPLALPPRSYVAITREAPWLEYGLDGLSERGSFHVVIGRW
ncbi:MAG: hypothetical protein AAGB00_03580 [Planctomycetota bacterium]